MAESGFDRHPDFANLAAYASTRRWTALNGRFLPIEAWFRQVFYKTTYPRSYTGSDKRPVHFEDGAAAVVCFNLPFDLSRIACGARQSQSEEWAGGFTFTLIPGLEDDSRSPFYPEVHVKPMDSRQEAVSLPPHVWGDGVRRTYGSAVTVTCHKIRRSGGRPRCQPDRVNSIPRLWHHGQCRTAVGHPTSRRQACEVV